MLFSYIFHSFQCSLLHILFHNVLVWNYLPIAVFSKGSVDVRVRWCFIWHKIHCYLFSQNHLCSIFFTPCCSCILWDFIHCLSTYPICGNMLYVTMEEACAENKELAWTEACLHSIQFLDFPVSNWHLC